MADLPIKLQSALETLVSGYAKEKLEKDARAISEAYRLRTGEGKRLLTAEGEAAAYAAARMPRDVCSGVFCAFRSNRGKRTASGNHARLRRGNGRGHVCGGFAA